MAQFSDFNVRYYNVGLSAKTPNPDEKNLGLWLPNTDIKVLFGVQWYIVMGE
jgi:hypothetical protein